MNVLKVAICDDNAKERDFFYNICKTIKEQENIQIKLKQYEHGEALLFDLEDTKVMNTVDIVLLDINMPGRNGIDVAHKLREYGYQGAIIFITKSEEHWRSAFDVKAFNYITKDNDIKERFMKVFWEAAEAAESRRGKTLLLSSVGETRQIAVGSISHFEVNQHLVTVYYNKDKFEFISSLVKIENMIFGNDFIRVHRSFLVSVSHIEKYNESEVVMMNGTVIPISRRYLTALKTAMADRVDGFICKQQKGGS